MTIAEYNEKYFGYIQNKENEIKLQQKMAVFQAWQTASLVAFAFHEPKKMPTLKELLQKME